MGYFPGLRKKNMNKLEIKKLCLTYKDKDGRETEALWDISVDVKDKEFVSIVGPSGCGKTTLLKVVSGIMPPSSGTVLINRKEIKKPSKYTGLIFQNPTSFPWLTVRENVEFGLRLQKLNKIIIEESAQHFINAVGLKGYEDSYLKSLSGGMKQRVAIATVLANDPDVLLMDEPFSNLDTQTKSLMQELVMAIWEETKKTVLFVTHDIEESIFLSDRVYVMGSKPGAIKEMIKIDLPRPRNPEMKLSEEFLQIKKHISYIIRGEAIKSAQVRLEDIRPKALNVGLHIWPGISPFYLAKELKIFDRNNVDVELLNLEKEKSRINALINGEVDLMLSTLDAAVLAKEKIEDLKIILVLNQSYRGDALIARQEFKSIEELKGKKIALEKEWVSHYFLLYILDKNGMSSKDVQIIDMKGSDIGSALISQEVDAAVLWEPWLSQAKHLSGTEVLASTEENRIISDVLVGKTEILSKKKEDIIKFVKSWFSAVDDFKKDIPEASKIASASLGISAKELENQLKKLIFTDKAINRKLLGNLENPGEISKDIKEANRIWIKESLMTKKVSYSDIADPSFVV